MEIELSAEEENAGSVAGRGAETARVGFDCRDFGVERLGYDIGDRMTQVSDDIFRMAFDHAGGKRSRRGGRAP